jgi:hypothetical protein
MTFHRVAFRDDGPAPITPDVLEGEPRDPPAPGEVPVYAVEYRLVGGQSRQKGNRADPATREWVNGVEILFAAADGRCGLTKRFMRETALDRHFRASMGADPDDLGPLEAERREQVRDVLQVCHHEHLPQRSPAQPAHYPGFEPASALVADGGAQTPPVPMVASEGPAGKVVAGPEPRAFQRWERSRGGDPDA